MNIAMHTRKTYLVGLDAKGMRRNEMGPGPLGTRIRCFLPLTGDVDDHWRQSFRAVQLEDTGFFRFRLEMGSKTIAFVSTETEDGGELAAELKTLAFLLDAVNAVASKG
jgi:hypothetical protein